VTNENPIRVGRPLDDGAFGEIRRAMQLSHHKWDVQVGDLSSLAPFPLLMSRPSWQVLARLAERLTVETLAVERALFARPDLYSQIALPRPLHRLFAQHAATAAAARVMRFDFHYTPDGWRISEVNSDVPGGFTEATNFARLVATLVPGTSPPGDPTHALVESLANIAGDRGVVALMNAPGHMEDHQVVAHLAAALRRRGLQAHLISPHHLRWKDGHAQVETAWCAGQVDAIVRFYQAEWLARLPRRHWSPLFVGGQTPVANPGIAALTESKRLPLVWDALGTAVPTWRQLLPETRPIEAVPWRSDGGWLIKSAYSNTGDTVSIREAMSKTAWARRVWSARLRPSQWVAQRRFTISPIAHLGGVLRPCIGVYTVDGKCAGAYARLARGPVVDFSACDAALLICDEA